MFDCKKCQAHESEIEFLRKKVGDLEEKLLSMVGDSLSKYQQKDFYSTPTPPPTYMDPLGHLMRMEATTDQEKKEKSMAIDQVQALLGN